MKGKFRFKKKTDDKFGDLIALNLFIVLDRQKNIMGQAIYSFSLKTPIIIAIINDVKLGKQKKK